MQYFFFLLLLLLGVVVYRVWLHMPNMSAHCILVSSLVLCAIYRSQTCMHGTFLRSVTDKPQEIHKLTTSGNYDIVMIGLSGSGKSTLLQRLSKGLHPVYPTDGTVLSTRSWILRRSSSA